MIDNFYCSPDNKNKDKSLKLIGEIKEINIEEEEQNLENIKSNDEIENQNIINSEIIQINDDLDVNLNLIIIKNEENDARKSSV